MYFYRLKVNLRSSYLAKSRFLLMLGLLFLSAVASTPLRAATKFDFDGDGKADIAVFRPSNKVWYMLNSQTGFSGVQFEYENLSQIVPADYDNDGKTDIAVFHPWGQWKVIKSSSGTINFSGYGDGYGVGRDLALPADYSGDGKADLALWRAYFYADGSPAGTATWFNRNWDYTGTPTYYMLGTNYDKPVIGDFDGDGKTDYTVYRPSNGHWYIQRSSLGFLTTHFGAAEDKPVVADYDGDGKDDIAVFRPSNGTWYLLQSTAGFTGTAFGFGTDLPVPADYDGDAKADVAVYRLSNGNWYLNRSSQGFTALAFGTAEDQPIPNAYIR